MKKTLILAALTAAALAGAAAPASAAAIANSAIANGMHAVTPGVSSVRLAGGQTVSTH